MKDESDWLASCLSHVKDLVDEIIIVDTGSKDNSVEIAKSFGAKVLFHPWVDDFSVVRNYSLQQATCDWILVLDADEILEKENHEKIRKLTNNIGCYLLTQRHYTNDVRLSGFELCAGIKPEFEKSYKGYFESALARLFPNYSGIHYRGAVHELVEYCLEEIPEITLYDPKIRIHHYGHTFDVKNKKDKSKLYTPLGQKKVDDKACGWKELFELAVEHNNNGRLKESAEAFEKSIKLNCDYLDSWSNLGYVYCELALYEKAESVLFRALELNSKSEEVYCNLGVVELRQGNFLKAEKYLRVATNLKPSYVNAWRNLSIALISQNKLSEAALVLKKILEMLPCDLQAINSLGSLYLSSGIPSEALKYFSTIYPQTSADNRLAIMISQSIKLTGDAASSLRFMMKHLDSNKDRLNHDQCLELSRYIDQETIRFFL